MLEISYLNKKIIYYLLIIIIHQIIWIVNINDHEWFLRKNFQTELSEFIITLLHVSAMLSIFVFSNVTNFFVGDHSFKTIKRLI